MKNEKMPIMIVKVKYFYGGATLSTNRFSYELANGKMFKDSIRISRDYSDNDTIDTAIKYLENVRNMIVIGSDRWGRDEGYIVATSKDYTFKSVSGKHETRIAELDRESDTQNNINYRELHNGA